jgi:hypothetical protein
MNQNNADFKSWMEHHSESGGAKTLTEGQK